MEQGNRLVPFQFDQTASEIVRRGIEGWGIRVFMGQRVESIEKQNGKPARAILGDGQMVPADLVIVAVGIAPNTDLAVEAGVKVRDGVVVDRWLRTSAPDIYAAADVAETVNLISGESVIPATWTAAVEMGRIAGSNMAGASNEYSGALPVQNAFLIAGIPTVSIGIVHPERSDSQYKVLSKTRDEEYRKLVFTDQRLVGALMVGDIEGCGIYNSLIKSGTPLAMSEDAMFRRRRGCTLWSTHLARACTLKPC